jgi:hypothetical protein
VDEPFLVEFYSFVIGFCFGNWIHGMLVCDLRNHFWLILSRIGSILGIKEPCHNVKFERYM